VKPRLLDLFAGAGGATRGYQLAGFHVTGVDIAPQPNYCGDEFVQADALSFPLLFGFDAIHASPPCQAYSTLAKGNHPALIEPIRARLASSAVPWIIENIETAPLRAPIRLCGSSFGLGVRRHRLFEFGNWQPPALLPPCSHASQGEIRAYYGKKGWAAWTLAGAQVQRRGRRPLLRGTVDQAADDMGIDWMTWDELREAIPPAYTQWIGEQLLAHLAATEGSSA
jgi:DNA (cytosine-5)-methyltransferase 1